MLPDTPQAVLHMEPKARNGLSLTHNGCLLRDLHSGVNGPGLLLRSLHAASLARSVFWLDNRVRFAPASGCFTASNPLPVPQRTWLTAPFRLHSPLGFLHPSGLKRSTEFAVCRLTFRFARSPIAPRCRFYY